MILKLNKKAVALLMLGLCGVASPWVLTPPRSSGSAMMKASHNHPLLVAGYGNTPFVLKAASEDEDPGSDDLPKKKKKGPPRRKKRKPSEEEKQAQKDELVKAVGQQMREQKPEAEAEGEDSNLLDRLNPFKAGQTLRKKIDTALTSISIPEETKSSYYMDDRFSSLSDGGMDRIDGQDYIPEVLVVGATGEVGRLVVQRLLLEGRFRVRVLVRDLYTKTLNMLGTGVTYCQGDLANVDSLEYAVTDVDKIIFCSNPPRPDEEQFQEKFQEFMSENLADAAAAAAAAAANNKDGKESSPTLVFASDEQVKDVSDEEWEEMDSVLELRARLAEQVDLIGLKNLLQAFQNVRHSDYGTSQAAKRSLFKFQDRPEDFNLFSLDTEEEEEGVTAGDSLSTTSSAADSYYEEEDDEDEDYDYQDYYDDDDDDDDYNGSDIETRRDSSVKTQTQWIRNQFGHGVFVGRVPQASPGKEGGETAVMSRRLRARQDPETGIDLGAGFAGFIARVCSDGGSYEAFVRTGAYYEDGVEYVCEFSTATKPIEGRNKSRNKFVTVRLPFENFKPVQRKAGSGKDIGSVPNFRGNDVRNLGFRYRSAGNTLKSKLEGTDEWNSFYLAVGYIKLYRSQPEPEIVYLSDAKVPPVVRNGMVRHEARQLLTAGAGVMEENGAVKLLDDSTLQNAAETGEGHRSSPEETYYKYRGEELIRSSGLNYAIARVAGFNEIPSSEASTIDLRPSNEEVSSMSRAEIAQVCVSALMDPNALNKSFYVTKKTGVVSASDEDMKEKFQSLPADVVA